MKKVCLVAYSALPVVDPMVSGHYGGLETAAWLTARGLALRSDVEVTFVVKHHRKRPVQTVDGVKVVTRWEPMELCRRSLAGRLAVSSRFPWLHFKRWDASLLWKIPLLAAVRPFKKRPRDPKTSDPFFENLQCDVYCGFGANAISASLVATAKKQQGQSLLLLQTNSDLDANYTQLNYRGEYGDLSQDCLYALKEADVIITQTDLQEEWLRERFGRDSFMLGNPFDTASWDESLHAEHDLPFDIPYKKYALWIGRADRFHKRPLIFLEIARQCPDVPFVMLLNKGDREVREEIEQIKPDNVTIIDHVPFHLMPAVFSRSFVFITTSSTEYEGLPNVFLQAAATNVPIVSYEFMPKNMRQGGFAFIPESTTKMVEQINEFWHNQTVAHQTGTKGRAYIQANSDITMYAEQIAKLL